ncbi:MAG: ATPase [Alloprevotella sp.]
MPTFHLIADSGSTKTDWALVASDEKSRSLLSFRTPGINPFMLSDEAIASLLTGEVAPRLSALDGLEHIGTKASSARLAIRFYGAGQRGSQTARTQRLLAAVWPEAAITVESDIVCAARALFGEGSGIACILGTGSNSALIEGGAVAGNVPTMGYILGDEGSGASLGRQLVVNVCRGIWPQSLCRTFFDETGLTADAVIERVYRPAQAYPEGAVVPPNRFLASLCPFLSAHIDCPEVAALVVDEMKRFFTRQTSLYGRPDLSVGFVGSIATHFSAQLAQAASETHTRLGDILAAPFERLERL